jgi:RNA polymerase sigma factor (sigma-70 family)
MDRHTQHTIYEEFLNRYERLIISRIYKFKTGDDVADLFQDVTIHIYQKIPVEFHKNPDAFSSSAWVVQVVDRFLISMYRKEKAKKNIHSKTISQLSDFQWNTIANQKISEDSDLHFTETEFDAILKVIFEHISRKDALMLKMKYYYNKNSDFISEKLNVSHVNMRLKRLKEQLQNRVPQTVYAEVKERFFKED